MIANILCLEAWIKRLRSGTFRVVVKIRTLVGHEEGIYSVAVSFDCKYIASCSEDNSIKVWKLETGE